MASVLETFYILFKTNSSDVKKGAEEAETTTKKLQASLESTGTAADTVGQAFLGLAKSFSGLIAGALSAATVITGIKEASDYAFQLGNISRLLGVNVSELDAWGNAVKRSGGTAEGFQSSLKALGQHLGGSPAVALQVLPQLADAFQRLGRYRAMQYGRMLGLDDSTILFLQEGRREVQAMVEQQRELGVVTAKDAAVSKTFNNELMSVETSFRMIFLQLSTAILPYLTKFLDVIIPVLSYMHQHIGLIKGALLAIASVAAVIAAPFIIAQAPLLLIIAGITTLIALFALAYEDVQMFLEGNKSLIGLILEKWPIVGTAVKTVFDSIKMAIMNLIEPLQLVWSIFEKIGSFFKGSNKKLSVDVQNGQAMVNTAGATPIGVQTPTSMFASSAYNRNNSINTGPITIQTQATDASGIAGSLGKGIQEHTRYANSFFDDGELA